MDNITELATALNEFQAELVTVSKSASNPFFKSKYADLATIMLASQPVLTKHGLSIVQLLDNLDGKPALTTVLMHKSGQAVKATIPLILTKEDPQGVGSAITYMRRYGYAAALQIVIDEDDDGNRASAPRQAYGAPAKTAPKAAVPSASRLAMIKGQIRNELHKNGVADENAKAYIKSEYGYDELDTEEKATLVLEKLRKLA